MMERTQIYLTKEQQKAVKSVAERRGKTQSEIIREAINYYIAQQIGDNRRELMHQAAGMWADRDDLPAFFEELRRELDEELTDEPTQPLPAGH